MDIFQHNKSTIGGTRSQALDLARARLALVAMVLMMGYLAVGLRLTELTLFRAGDAAAQQAALEGIKPLTKPLRGSILDRHGALLASSLKMASVYADATLIESPEHVARQLAAILPEQDHSLLVQKLSSGKRFVWIERNITPKQEYAINALGNPALGFQEEDHRIYPNAALAAHITGYTDVDGRGIAGVEKFFNKQLSEAAEPLSEAAEPVSLTIDLRIQHALHRELAAAVKKFRAKNGSGLVMDVNTGEIIALVSLPDFDPNRAGEATDRQKFNNATLGVYEMGSTFKLFSTAAALDSGLARFSTVFDATDPIRMGRFTISDFHPKRRPLTVPEIFIYSSNIGTAKMAAALGNEGMQDFYRRMGFMETAPLELPERGAPLYPSPWRDISTLTTSYGHGIAVSPLHVVRAAAALVNGGIMPQPTLVKKENQGLSLVPQGERVVSAKTSQQMRQLLELGVVSGTGNNAAVEGYDVGGKTGTAEKNSKGSYDRTVLLSSFLGVFPIHAPRYAVLVLIDEPQGTADTHGYATGGWTAAPVVARVIEQIAALTHMPPSLAPDASRPKLISGASAPDRQSIVKEMAAYLKDLKEGSTLAAVGTDR